MMDFWTLQIQFSISVIIVLILRACMKKLPKIYSYLLWILVFARLLCPFHLEMEYAIMPKAEIVTEFDDAEDTSKTSYLINGETIAVTKQKMPESTGNKNFSENTLNFSEEFVKNGLKILWFFGALICLVYNFAALLILMEKLKDAKLLEEQVYETEKIENPITIGLIGSRIYIPSYLNQEERAYIIFHEKIHARRKDYLIKNIAFLLTAIYWFNPLCWTAFHFLELDMEMSCDEAVVAHMGSDIKKQYSQSLLNFAAGQKNRAFTPITFGEVGVKERIKNVLKNQKTRRWMTVIGMIILLFSGILVFTTKKTEVPDDQKEAQAFVESWTKAFVERDTEYILQHTNELAKEKYETEWLLIDNEDGTYDFGWSSPWPWGLKLPYQISEITGNQAIIYYAAQISEPHVIVWRDVITFQKQEYGNYLVTDSLFEKYEQITSLDEFLKAYPEGLLNDTPVDYLTNDLGSVLNRHAKERTEMEEYQKLFSVETAARYLLNLSGDEDLVKIAIAAGEPSEKECTVRIIFTEEENCIDIKMIQPYGADGIWIPQTAENGASEDKGEMLTFEMFLNMVDHHLFEKTAWRNFQNAVTDTLDQYSLNYYVDFYFDYEGEKIELAISADKESEGEILGIWLKKADDSSLWIYEGDEDVYRCTSEEILTFVQTDYNILNEVSLELPEGLSMDEYYATVGFEGGCLFLPMAYEADSFTTDASWKSSGMISRYTQDQMLVWQDNQIIDVANYYNHTSKEVIESVEGLCAPALLLHYEHDLYTASDLAALQEQGTEIDSIETTSSYWYLFIAEPGAEYGYVITLTEKNHTQNDILKIGKSFKILE